MQGAAQDKDNENGPQNSKPNLTVQETIENLQQATTLNHNETVGWNKKEA